MARRTFHTAMREARQKRQNVWFIIDVDPVAVAADAVVNLATFNAEALAFRPFTIVRTHILGNWGSDQLAASETPSGALGISVTSDQATSITGIPNPIANADSSSFIVWQPLLSPFLFGDATGFIEPSGQQFTIDSKAMRKVGPNETIRIIVENSSPTDGAIISMVGRMLVKLH